MSLSGEVELYVFTDDVWPDQGLYETADLSSPYNSVETGVDVFVDGYREFLLHCHLLHVYYTCNSTVWTEGSGLERGELQLLSEDGAEDVGDLAKCGVRLDGLDDCGHGVF